MASRKKRRSRLHVLVNAACLVFAVLAAIGIVLGKSGNGVEPPSPSIAVAFGAPNPKPKPAVADAAAPAEPAAAAAEAPKKKEKDDDGKKGKDPENPDPIDLAIAPDGGVPFHPGNNHFKSPFAKPGATPLKVKVGMLLNSIDGYDVKTGTYTADFFLSLTAPGPMPTVSLQFPNGTVDKKEDIADRPSFKLYRITGNFKSAADLRKYPFDAQELKIVMEDDSHGTDQLEFVVDHERTQLARGFRAVGWQVSYVEGRSQAQSYPDRFENDDLFYSRYTYAIGVERFATSAAFKVFVPAFVIVIISLLGMWVPAEEMEVRSNSGAPMLAGAVLFHFALMQELPATAYLTRADKLMLGVYVSLALGMVSTWWMFLVKEHNVPKVFRIARIAVPILSSAVMLSVCIL